MIPTIVRRVFPGMGNIATSDVFGMWRNAMRKMVVVSGIWLGLLLSNIAPAVGQTPDAVIELAGGSVAAGIGCTWGNGTLIFQGKRYPLKVSGMSLASVGVTEYTLAGSITGLKTPQDINGIYTTVAVGGTLGGGGGAAAMQNQNGVVIHTTSTSEGLSLALAAEGVKITLDR
jgi:hypothetical protein